MLSHINYILPNNGKKLILGNLVGSSGILECAKIVNRHLGLILLITIDKQHAIQIYHGIKHFTSHPIWVMPNKITVPYDLTSPHKKIISDRLSILYQLPKIIRGMIITTVDTVMQLIFPNNYLYKNTILIHKNKKLSIHKLYSKLKLLGYCEVSKVINHGEFSIHNTIINLYPMGYNQPYQINFINTIINDLFIFNLDTQKTIKIADYINLLPVYEFPIDKHAINLFCNKWNEQFNIKYNDEYIYQQIVKGNIPNGIEYWQPFFFKEPLVTLFSYLPLNTLIINTHDLNLYATLFWKTICTNYHEYSIKNTYPLLHPKLLWIPVNILFSEINKFSRVYLTNETIKLKFNHYNMLYQKLPDLMIDRYKKQPLDKLQHFCNQRDELIIFVVNNKNKLIILKNLLATVNIVIHVINTLKNIQQSQGFYLIVSTIKTGFIDMSSKQIFICEEDILGYNIECFKQNNYLLTKNLYNIPELQQGDPVIHLEHGVGRYTGITILEINGNKAEYLILTYANNDKLYVPVSSLHLIRRYDNVLNTEIPLHKLGSDTWIREYHKVTHYIRDIAAELLNIYAKRKTQVGFAFYHNQEQYKLFCNDFPYNLTIDQAKAIQAVLNDMCQPLPMNRLISGDVGFGKTEIAMRAAFLAVMNHKQVAVLVPTTLLAQQHFDNFCNRFIKWPISIKVISRFSNNQQENQIIKELNEGKINILIGTHKLLQNNIQWNDLGLLIIDEEHRFGVSHKEHIKYIHSNIDILTLSATPIPRTLNMVMNTICDLSIIATPPTGRHAIKIFIHEFDNYIIRKAILNEISRGGQVYYIHNNIDDIEQVAINLRVTIPEANIMVGHGKMLKYDLEHIICDFYHQRFNVLVCTTIIESGIDIANANTIIISYANCFGLSQLYQLCGRVGRSYHQAYAYLFIPPINTLNENTRERLKTISSINKVGMGFTVATRDLEIRGGGELLGIDQSGKLETIGFSLYMELLERTIESLKTGQESSILQDIRSKTIEIELCIPSFIPAEYISNINSRLSFYNYIANATSKFELESLKETMINQFGILPYPTIFLLEIAKIKLQATSLGIKHIKSNNQGGFIEFITTNDINHSYIIELLQNNPNNFRLENGIINKLKFICDLTDFHDRLYYIKTLLSKLKKTYK